ncbi:IS5 family transposase [Streptomyces sp. NPDC058757]|uniref:IS5 family transposase n=1 Tax=Streptomyces sp. NPDC058757 TaxID=3346626 RepID=UPI0036C6167A
MGRGDLSDEEWARLEPHLPTNRGRGGRWRCHRRVINGILFRQRTGLLWRDLPPCFGGWKTVHDRHRRWSADGTWERIPRAVQADADAGGRIDWSTVSVDSTTCRAHQHAAGASPVPRRSQVGAGARCGTVPMRPGAAREAGSRARSTLPEKVGAVRSGLSSCPAGGGDAPQMIPVLEEIRVPRQAGGRPRTRPDHVGGDKASSSRRNRRHLRRRQIKHTIPAPRDQRANRRRRGSQGGRPTGFDKTIYRCRNEVERTINRPKNFRAVATRFDKRAYVFRGTVTVAAIRLWLRPV